MTQDQYGQAQGAGYGVRGDVVEDENDEYADDPAKPMTRFQKVASALRGDRPDPDEMDDDQVTANQRGTASPTATSPDVVTDADEATDPDLVTDSDAVTDPDLVTDSDVVTDQDVAYNSGSAANSDVAANSGAVTSSDPDAMPSGRGYPPTQPNAAVAAGSPDSLDAQETGGRTAVDPNGAAGTTGSSARRGNYWDDSDTAAASQAEAATVTTPDVPVADVPVADVDAANGYASNESVPAQDQGAATIPDVPVTQPAGDAAVSEVPGRTGRHAGVPAQELHPGEATDTLDDLGDLAYGNLLPDAADFTAQWQQIQFRFVDDPQASVTEAAEVVSQVTAKLEAAIQERQRAIAERQQAIAERQRSLRGRWGEGSEADTETLRETLRMYRAFLDQLIGSKA
jgi:hypothetical protein